VGGRSVVRQLRSNVRHGAGIGDVRVEASSESAGDAPIWARSEPAGATFEARRVSQAGRGPIRAAALAVAALGALVAFASLKPSTGSLALDPASIADAGIAAAPAATSPQAQLPAGGWPPSRAGTLAFVPVSLDVPRPADAITTGYVAVQGTLRGRAEEVRITLQTLDRRPLTSTVVNTAFLDGGIRPVRTPTIDVRLEIPAPRPVGQRLWVVIVSYDGLGTPIGAMRRPVNIGALTAEAPGA